MHFMCNGYIWVLIIVAVGCKHTQKKNVGLNKVTETEWLEIANPKKQIMSLK